MFKYSLLLVIGIAFFSCKKIDAKKDNTLTYYTEEYKDKDLELLGVHSSAIEAVWFEFDAIDKSEESYSYKMFVKENGELHKEYGTCQIDWYNSLAFTPTTNTEAFNGEFTFEKEKFSISYDLETRTEELIFVYKEEKKHCKW